MAGETIITVVGNLTADPELRYTQNGLAVANFTIASTPRNFDRATNDWKDGEALFLRASVWREFAEHVAGSLTKGSRVIATGRLKQRSYETKEGEKRTSIELEVDEIGPSLRYATAQVTRAASTRDASGGAAGRPAVATEEPWAAAHPSRGFRRVEHAGQLQRRDPLLTSRKQTMAGKSSGDRRKAPRKGKDGKNAAPAKAITRRRHRLQGCRDAPQVHLRARQDPRSPHHRCLRAGAAPHRDAPSRTRARWPCCRTRARAVRSVDRDEAHPHARGHRPRRAR